MINKRIVFWLGAVAGLWTAVASANTMSAFGLQYSSLGGATLSSADGGVGVSNIGTSGTDGVSIALPAVASSASNPISFSLDTSIDGMIPTGDYLQQTAYGPGTGGVTTALATVTQTQSDASDTSVTADFSNLANGQSVTVEYYSGGPGGTLEYTYTGPMNQATSTIVVPIGGNRTAYGDFSWSGGITAGLDTGPPLASFYAPDGTTQLSDIDFIDFVAPTNLDSLQYTSISMTGGGPSTFGSFAITGEAMAVPEPSSWVLLSLALCGIGVAAVWKRRNVAMRSE